MSPEDVLSPATLEKINEYHEKIQVAEDIYVLYLKGVNNNTGVPTEVIELGGIFTKEGTSVNSVVPEMPDETPEKTPTNNNISKEEIKNPKTGVSMPITLGLGVIALASIGIIVCNKFSTKQL